MESWESYSLGQSRTRPTTQRSNPSFSSTLLDAIYRSIDEGDGGHEEELIGCKEKDKKKKQSTFLDGYNGAAILKTACRTEKNFVSVRQSSDYDRFQHRQMSTRAAHSTSTSSDSSFGGFSSSETESVYRGARPKPIRTSLAPTAKNDHNLAAKHRHTLLKPLFHHRERDDESYNKTNSRNGASPKKAKKQPVSPGARLAGFLNALFAAAGTAKKAKLSSSFTGEDYMRRAAPPSSTCSSASSYSRSCLSKTPSSRDGKSVTPGDKRSVRFYPVSIILDEECRPCSQKVVYQDEKVEIIEKSQVLDAAASRILNRYKTKTEILMRSRDALPVHKVIIPVGNDEYDDDAASDASSDLFELKNFGSIGVDRYREELPVYETTHLVTNRAIANGLIM